MLGKLNNDEFAMGSSNETSFYGPAISPWRRKGANTPLVPGGSSGGSAAAVAATSASGATGTDTGGSIRQPAAFTGIVGIKPTYGRCSRWGIVAFASSLDQAGPFARTVRDTAILLRSMAGHDPKDTTCVDLPVPDYEAAVGRSIKGMKIGIPKEYRVDGMAAEIEKLWEQGAELAEGRRRRDRRGVAAAHQIRAPAYYIVAPAEASSNLARYDGVRYGLREPGRDIIGMYEATRAQGFGKEVRRRIMIGTYVLSAGYYDAYYLRAQKVRTLIKRDFEAVLRRRHRRHADALDAVGGVRRRREGRADPMEMYLNDVFTVTVNMAGLPGMAVPGGLVGRRPAARPATDRPAVRRGDAVRAWPGDRARRRAVLAGALVVNAPERVQPSDDGMLRPPDRLNPNGKPSRSN